MRHGNGCSSVEQHLENLKVVPDGVDDDDEEKEGVTEGGRRRRRGKGRTIMKMVMTMV